MSWQNLLTEVLPGHHIAQVYKDETFLLKAVSLFIETGLQRNEAVVMIVTDSHREALLCRLRDHNIHVETVIAQGQLIILDAHETLYAFMLNGAPDFPKFRGTIGQLLDNIVEESKFTKIRAYGEMVDILWRQGNLNAAIQLEEFWNDLLKIYQFSLFCAYTMDGLDKDVNSGPLQAVCKAHSHFIPTDDYTKFESALDEATHRILGTSLAGMLRTISATEQNFSTVMPPAQTVLFWLKEHMPVTADKILAYTRQCLESRRSISIPII